MNVTKKTKKWNDASKMGGDGRVGITHPPGAAARLTHPEQNQPWFVVDKEGLRRTLSRKGKAFAIYELLQNGYDENSTKLEVTLTEPKNGKSVLTCIDNAPNGYMELSNAHTMFRESTKKTDANKRGRFNVGEKYVLALCDSATVTSMTGRTVFKSNGTRVHDNKKTAVGTEFRGEMPLTKDEYNDMVAKVKLVIPPVQTIFNGVEIPQRKALHSFTANLPTEVADENGVLRTRTRATQVRLYEVLKGQSAMLYEMGMPVVNIDCKWSVDIQQKVPLNIERDNVTPSYLKTVYQAVLDERSDFLNEDDAAEAWVSSALSTPKIKIETVKKIASKRFGEDAVLYDQTDLGANREAVAAGRVVIPRGAVTPEIRKNLVKAGVQKASKEFGTSSSGPSGMIPDSKLTKPQLRYKKFIEQVAPLVLDHPLSKVEFANDPDAKLYGCTQWLRLGYIFTVNVAHHDVEDWNRNYDLFIHELAHFYVQRNDHLFEGFWCACSDIGGKLAQVALERPELFPINLPALKAA